MPTVVGVKLRFTPKTLWFDPVSSTPEPPRAIPSSSRPNAAPSSARSSRHHTRSTVERAASCRSSPSFEWPTEGRSASAPRNSQPRSARRCPSFRELVEEYELDMKPIDVEYLFDGDKVVFYFVAEERVDFRDLVRDLAAAVQGAHRHAPDRRARRGPHGRRPRPLRRAAVLRALRRRVPAGLDPHGQGAGPAAEPLKISGLCGRLMCCLRYEFDAYKDFKRRAPKRGAIVETPAGTAQGHRAQHPEGARHGSDSRRAPTSRCRSLRWDAARAGRAHALSMPTCFAEAAGTKSAPVAVIDTPSLETASPTDTRRSGSAPSDGASERPAGGGGGGGGGRRRRDRGRGKGASKQGGADATKETPKPQPKAAATPQKAAPKSGQTPPQAGQGGNPESAGGESTGQGRRRRRRRSSGGGAGGGEQVQ